MSWDAYRRRDEVLRRVTEHVARAGDGSLPWTEVAGVPDTFDSPEDLLRALQMRWHTRLAGRVDAELDEQPTDLEAAVERAWRETAADLPGERSALDAHEHEPALVAARHQEMAFLATAAGLAPLGDPRAVALGQQLRERARTFVLDRRVPDHVPSSWMSRLRSLIAT
jgi:hypothetical protein